ncbi:MAG: DsbA family protein [Longimicrobiales bacterium]
MRRFREAIVVAAAASAAASSGQAQVADGTGYIDGRDEAPVTVVEFLDFGCSACAHFARETLPSVRRVYIETGRVRWQAVPFVLGAFPNSAEAARAAACAAEQQAFWEMHDVLLARRAEWTKAADPLPFFAALASALRLDAASFEACYDSDSSRERVARQNRAAKRLHVRATPTFFIAGRRVLGALEFELFGRLLDEALVPSR